MELHGFTSCLYLLHDRLHPASIYYMTDYILPLMITCLITSCLYRLHVLLHAPECCQCSPLSIDGQRVGPSAATQRSLCRPAGETSARDKQSFFCQIQFARQYSSMQRSDMQQTDKVAASTRYLHNWSRAVQMVVGTSGAWNIQDVTAKYSSNPAKCKD